MRKLSIVALLAVAIGATLYLWPENQRPTSRSEVNSAGSRDSSTAKASSATPAQKLGTTSAPLPERAPQEGAVERPSAKPVRISIHAPLTVRLGEAFSVTIQVQAMQGIRQLVFSVVYKKSILELVGSSPGAFAQQGGPSVQFEEVSDGSVLVRIGMEGGVIAGAGSVAVVQFRALGRGVSPLAINGVTYVVEGRQHESNDPVAYEGTITVE